MSVELALIIGFLVTFGIMMVVIGTVITTEQRTLRQRARSAQSKVERIGDTPDHEKEKAA